MPRLLSGDPQLLGMWFQGVDHELDVLVEVNVQQLHPALDDLPIDLGGKRLVLEFLLDAFRFERCDTPPAEPESRRSRNRSIRRTPAGPLSRAVWGVSSHFVWWHATAWAISSSPRSRSQSTIRWGCSSGH